MARILVVEDDPHNARVFAAVLERLGGHRVRVTEDGDEILRAAREDAVDLILLDVSLSNTGFDGRPVDGIRLCQVLKGNPHTRGVPVLLATAHAMVGDRERFLAASGADGYLAKPVVGPGRLVREVNALIQKGQGA